MKLYLLGQKNGICRESQMKLGHDCPQAEDTKSEDVFFSSFFFNPSFMWPPSLQISSFYCDSKN